MVSMPRGTTSEVVVALSNDLGEQYFMSSADKLILGVKTSVHSNTYIISKIVTNASYNEAKGGYVIPFEPEDTETLAFAKYVYDVGLQTGDGDFYIVCPCDSFEIAETVTERVVE